MISQVRTSAIMIQGIPAPIIIIIIIGLRNTRTSGDHLNYSIGEIGHNTKRSPGDLRRLADTQTPVEDDHLTLG